MGITFGDYLIDFGYYEITPEQERERDMNNIKREFQKGETNYLDTIEALMNEFGLSSLDAEAMVDKWFVSDAGANWGLEPANVATQQAAEYVRKERERNASRDKPIPPPRDGFINDYD